MNTTRINTSYIEDFGSGFKTFKDYVKRKIFSLHSEEGNPSSSRNAVDVAAVHDVLKDLEK